MKKLLIPLIIGLLVALMLGSCSSSTPATTAPPSTTQTATQTTPVAAAPKTLTIGDIDALSGAFSNIMKYVPEGAELAKDYINSKGGITIKGEKYNIDLLIRDCKSTPDGATAAANELVYDKLLKFIAGTGPAPLTTPINAVTEPAGVMYTAIYQNGLTSEMGTKYPLKFVGSNCSFSAQITTMTYLKQAYPNVKTLAFILVDDGQIQYNDPIVRASATSLGLSIKGDIVGFTMSTQDFTPIAQKAVSIDADAIMIGNAISAHYGLMLKSIRGLGYSKPIFAASYPVLPDIMEVAADAANGFFSNGLPSDPTIPNLPKTTQDVLKLAIAKYGKLNTLHVQGFDAVYTMVQAIEKAQSLEPKAVAAAWEKMDAIDTIFGAGKMGGLQTYGVNHNVYFNTPISVIKNGKIELATWIPVDTARRP
jgi:branched-chain amino acid transport system substrate-binding protein